MAKPQFIRVPRRNARRSDGPAPDLVVYDQDGLPVLVAQVKVPAADYVIDTAEGNTIGFGDLTDEEGLNLSEARTDRSLELLGFDRETDPVT